MSDHDERDDPEQEAMACGHPRSDLRDSDEGTSYCAGCEREARVAETSMLVSTQASPPRSELVCDHGAALVTCFACYRNEDGAAEAIFERAEARWHEGTRAKPCRPGVVVGVTQCYCASDDATGERGRDEADPPCDGCSGYPCPPPVTPPVAPNPMVQVPESEWLALQAEVNSLRADIGRLLLDRVVVVVCDGPPGPAAGRMVEVEDGQGRSLAGEWRERVAGIWECRVAVPESGPQTVHPSNMPTIVDLLTTERDGARTESSEWRADCERKTAMICQAATAAGLDPDEVLDPSSPPLLAEAIDDLRERNADLTKRLAEACAICRVAEARRAEWQANCEAAVRRLQDCDLHRATAVAEREHHVRRAEAFLAEVDSLRRLLSQDVAGQKEELDAAWKATRSGARGMVTLAEVIATMRERLIEVEAELAKCHHCGGAGRMHIGCRYCGDSTFDHECDDHDIDCPYCRGTGRHP